MMKTKLSLVTLTSILAVIILVMPQTANALAISPGSATIDLVPGEEQTIFFQLVNNEQINATLKLSAIGELASGFLIPDEYVELKPKESKKIKLVFSAPIGTPAGEYKARIRSLAAPDKGSKEGIAIFTLIGLDFLVNINIRESDKESELFAASNLFSGGPLLEIVSIELSDIGKQDISEVSIVIDNIGDQETLAYADVEIIDESLKTAKKRLKTGSQRFPPQLQKTIIAYFDSTDLEEGRYSAQVSLHYSGQTVQKTTGLQILRQKTKTMSSAGSYAILGGLISITAVLTFAILGKFLNQKKQKKQKLFKYQRLN